MAKQPKSKDQTRIRTLIAELISVYAKTRDDQAIVTLEALRADAFAVSRPFAELIQLQRKSKEPPLSESDAKADRVARFKRFRLKTEAPDCGIGVNFEFDPFLPEGSGVRALKDLAENDNFMTIPRKLSISTETMLVCPYADILRTDQMCQGVPSLAVAVHLMLERLNPKSYWRPYLDVLPETFNLPLHFSLEEIDALQGSPSQLDALRMQRSTIRQYLYLQRLFKAHSGKHPGLPDFTYDELVWAISVVMTRQNQIPASNQDKDSGTDEQGEEQKIIALIPGWDMCNYKPGWMATFYEKKLSASLSFTMAPVKAGEQIYIHYGDRPNSKLFLFMGFVVADHPADTLQYRLSLDEKHPLFKVQSKLVAKDAAFQLPIDEADSEEYSGLLRFLRVSALTKDEMAVALKQAGKDTGAMISLRNETAAWELLLTALQQLLAGYGAVDDAKRLAELELQCKAQREGKGTDKSTAADTESKKGGNKAGKQSKAGATATSNPEHLRVIVQLRLAEKRLITEAIASVQARIKRLREQNGGSVASSGATGDAKSNAAADSKDASAKPAESKAVTPAPSEQKADKPTVAGPSTANGDSKAAAAEPKTADKTAAATEQLKAGKKKSKNKKK